MSDTLCYASATELALRIRRGDLSPVDVVEAHLDRIETRNDDINAYVTVIADDAREAAREAERAVCTGDDLGPLHGVPVALKDLFGWKAGVRNTFGSKLFADFVPDQDAIFVERLERAGAIVLGKTNTPEFALGTTTDNLVFGRTGNPFDPRKNAGGSSGGSAAALADGLAPLAQGSDAGGSVRIPAALCGVYGLKPSFARIPLVRPSRPNTFLRHTPYFQLGPMARTVEDAALMLDVMAGPHLEDPFTLPEADADYVTATRRSIDDLDVAYSPDLGAFPIDPHVRRIVDEAVDAFPAAGATVETVDPPLQHSQADILDVFYTWARVMWGALVTNLGETHDVDPYGADRDALRPEFVATILEGEEITAAEYKRTDVVRTDIFEGIQSVLSEYDLVVTPTLAVPPFDMDDPPTEIDGTEIEPLRGWVLTQPFNMTGHPVASIPAGFTDDGLPVGLQIVGHRFADDDVLAASAAFERIRPWHDAYPPR